MASIIVFVILAYYCLGGSGRQAHEDAKRLEEVKSIQADLKTVLSMCQVLQPGVCTMLNYSNECGNTMFIS